MPDFGFEYIPELSDFPAEERSPAVVLLLGICRRQREQLVLQQKRIELLQAQILEQSELIANQSEQIALQAEEIARLKDEIARLKGEKGRPLIKPSALNKGSEDKDIEGKGRNRGKPRMKKTCTLQIHEEKIIEPAEIPDGSRFKGYEDYTVQDITICLKNTLFRRSRYQTPDGTYIAGELPAEVRGSHFGPTLRSFCLSQYHQQRVPENLILRQLTELGVHISAGQLSQMLTEGHEQFHKEKEAVLVAGLAVSSHVNVDDTGARHKGKNGFATHIGNEQFAYFSSTDSKSRINFLEILSCGEKIYTVDDVARDYMRQRKCPNAVIELLSQDMTFTTKALWQAHLNKLGITTDRHCLIVTEGALVATLINSGTFSRLVIVSDDAGQFHVFGFLNALCWIHAERTINKLIACGDAHRDALALVKGQIWDLYQRLKRYKLAPSPAEKLALNNYFDEIFTQKTCFISLNLALQRIYENKNRLLMVLERPATPLHNNLSENDIRDYVTKRKISATTRSNNGRNARDTFLSLKKTCRKLEISFWSYLQDRIGQKCEIPPLSDIIRANAQAP